MVFKLNMKKLSWTILIILGVVLISILGYGQSEQYIKREIANDLEGLFKDTSLERIDFETVCIANMKGDGSETMITEFENKTLKKKLNKTIKHVKRYVGPESRIYIYLEKRKDQILTIEIETSKAWNCSKRYYRDYHVKYENGIINEIVD